MPYKKEYHTFVCPRCGKSYQVLTPAYLRKIKDLKYGSYCTSCRAKIQWEELPDEEKRKLQERSREVAKKQYDSLTDEQKATNIEKRRVGAKAYWDALSDSERAEKSSKRSMDRKEFLANLSDEQMKEIGRKISKSRKEASARMTPEQLAARKSHYQEVNRQYWEGLSEEQRSQIVQSLGEGHRKWWDSLTDDERAARIEKLKEDRDKYIVNATEEDIARRIQKFKESFATYIANRSDEEREAASQRTKQWWESLTDEEFDEMIRKMSEGHRRYWENASEEKHQEMSKQSKDWWASLNDDQKREFAKRNHQWYHDLDEASKKAYSDMRKDWYENLPQEAKDRNAEVARRTQKKYWSDPKRREEFGIRSKKWWKDLTDEERRRIISNLSEKQKQNWQNPEYRAKFSKSYHDYWVSLPDDDYDSFIKEQFRLCRSIDFPYPRYSDNELIKSWNNLVKMDPSREDYNDPAKNTRLGDRIIQHFHPSIYHAHIDGKRSPYDAWYNDELLMKAIKNRIIYQNHLNPNKILQGFNISKIAPKVSVFSAGRAKLLISKYLNEFTEVFDPFSGFSGRMLGAVSLGKRYIGQDISSMHVDESNDIINFLNIGDLASVSWGDALQSSGEYQCLFTCPPYEDKEFWGGINPDIKTCDDWIDVCLKNFKCKRYLFVVDHTNRYKDKIVYTLTNQSHFGKNNEYIVMI